MLTVDLQAGFSGDTVVVHADGREVFRGDDVTTDYALGRAASVPIDVARGAVEVRVDVPSRGISGTFVMDITTTAFLGVSVGEAQVDFYPSKEPFVYF